MSVTPTVLEYSIDPAHTRVHFAIKHMMIATVRGEFTAVTGKLSGTPSDPSSLTVEATLDANSFHTGVSDRDNHVKGPDMLDVAQFPTIEFKAAGATTTGERTYDITGNLTLHGVTKPIRISITNVSEEVDDPWGMKRVAVSGKAKINRNDFGVTFNAPFGIGKLLGEELDVDLDLQFVRKP